MPQTILVTGGAGYIGSHTCVELLDAGHSVIVLDNFCVGKRGAIERIGAITGKTVRLVEADVRDAAVLDRVFADHPIDAVVHFAGLKAVGESVAEPLRYCDNNVAGAITLVQAMERAGCRQLVFSSSATVYGDPERCPISEDAPVRPANPYGATKAMIERILTDLAQADARWRIALLRYFNPVGAHASGRLGEDPAGIPNNLMPYIAQVAVGKLARLTVHGNDYSTRDGTGERDYIHVVDLAGGHLAALAALPGLAGAVPINLGTGRPYSVLEMLAAFGAASGREIDFVIGPRRPGDVATCFADPARAAQLLGWTATLGIERMCADAWRWQQANPRGYSEA